MPNSNKNFGLTEEEFNELLAQLATGDETLIEVIFKAHFEQCRRFLMSKMQTSYETAYDITKDTLLKFRKNLLAGKIQYGNMNALFTIDAKNNFLKWKQKQGRLPKVALDKTAMDIEDVKEERRYDDETIHALKNALKKVGEHCFELISWHYYLGFSQKEIAEKRMMRGDEKFVTDKSVKTKLAECRKKLKQLL